LFGKAREQAIEEGLGTDSYFQADIDLAKTDRALSSAHVHVAFNEDELEQRAEIFARACYRISGDKPIEYGLQLASDYAQKRGIQPPEPGKRSLTPGGCLNRLICERWWRRAMRRTYARKAEQTLRSQGFVHKGAGLYVSAEAFQSTIDRKAANLRLLEEALATNDLGQSFSLSELSARNTSNPIVRRAEVMVRAHGWEDHAREHGHVASLFVITLSSRFHRMDERGGRVSKFDGSTPRDGQEWLNRQWRRMRSSMHRKGIQFYGLRTVEPHHDATPHWNVLVFAAPADMAAVAAEFDKYFLRADSPDEPGACTRRVRRVEIDPSRGGATSYIAKYISKNIDGFGIGSDHEDSDPQRDASETCIRAEVWASIHGIRQFQFFGGPAVTVWRELRRLRRPSMGIIEEARCAADSPDWCGFVRAMGGVGWSPTARPVRLHKIHEDTVGAYGDPLGSSVVGVESDDLVEVTRPRTWFVEWCPERNEDAFHQVQPGSFLPWSPVTNCTRLLTDRRGQITGML